MEKIRLLILGMTAYSLMAPVKYVATDVYQPTTIANPTVPLIREIPGGMIPGRVIYIVGVPSPRATRFIIDLYCGPKCSPMDILFHISVRFKWGQSIQNMVILNSRKQGAWGKEERPTSFPFKPNVQFEIKIVCEPSSFKVYVNSQCLAEFVHRINLKKATHITVHGDTRLTQVRFEEQPLPPGISTGPSGCSLCFTRIGGVCYGIFKEKKSWNDAKQTCKAMGRFLAEPKSLQENKNIVDLVKANDGGNTWIGATAGHWVWDHSETNVTFTDWADGEPNYCAHLSVIAGHNYRWKDASCNQEFSFVCQELTSPAFTPPSTDGVPIQGASFSSNLQPSACLVYACFGLCLMISLMK